MELVLLLFTHSLDAEQVEIGTLLPPVSPTQQLNPTCAQEIKISMTYHSNVHNQIYEKTGLRIEYTCHILAQTVPFFSPYSHLGINTHPRGVGFHKVTMRSLSTRDVLKIATLFISRGFLFLDLD